MSRSAQGKNNGKEGWYQGRRGNFGSLKFNYEQSHNRDRDFYKKSRNESNKNNNNNNTDKTKKIWQLSLDDFPSIYIHNRNKHFHRAIKYNKLVDAITNELKNECMGELKDEIQRNLMVDPNVIKEVRKWDGENEQTYLDYILSRDAIKDILAIRRFFELATLEVDKMARRLVNNQNKDGFKRNAGEMQYYLRVMGSNRGSNQFAIDTSKPGEAARTHKDVVEHIAENILGPLNDMSPQQCQALADMVVTRAEEIAEATYNNSARVSGKTTKNRAQKNKEVVKSMMGQFDWLKTAEGNTIFNKLTKYLNNARGDMGQIKNLKKIHDVAEFANHFLNGQGRQELGILFEDVVAEAIQGRAMGTENATFTTTDVVKNLDDTKVGISLKFQTSDNFIKEANMTMEQFDSTLRSPKAIKHFEYFMLNYAVLGDREMRGLASNDDDYLLNGEVQQIYRVYQKYAAVIAFVQAVIGAGINSGSFDSHEGSPRAGEKNPLPGILIINNKGIYTFDLVQQLMELADNPDGIDIEVDFNIEFDHSMYDTMFERKKEIYGSYTTEKANKKQYNMFNDSELINIFDQTKRSTFNKSNKFMKGTVSIDMAKIMN